MIGIELRVEPGLKGQELRSFGFMLAENARFFGITLSFARNHCNLQPRKTPLGFLFFRFFCTVCARILVYFTTPRNTNTVKLRAILHLL